jgi:hypothetical protein
LEGIGNLAQAAVKTLGQRISLSEAPPPPGSSVRFRGAIVADVKRIGSFTLDEQSGRRVAVYLAEWRNDSVSAKLRNDSAMVGLLMPDNDPEAVHIRLVPDSARPNHPAVARLFIGPPARSMSVF